MVIYKEKNYVFRTYLKISHEIHGRNIYTKLNELKKKKKTRFIRDGVSLFKIHFMTNSYFF